MKFESLGAFVAVAEAGSVSAAARQLALSKSVVSERLADLERSLGAQFVQRTTRKLALTEDGVTFLVRARRILSEAEDARAELAERRGELAGPLRISALSPSARYIWASRRAPAASRRHGPSGMGAGVSFRSAGRWCVRRSSTLSGYSRCATKTLVRRGSEADS
jgi:DNA-binding transcriptional LysR family regulator